jgi:N-acetyltransferase
VLAEHHSPWCPSHMERELPPALVDADSLVLEGARVRLEPLEHAHVPALLAAAAGGRESYTYSFVPDGAAEMAQYVAKAVALRAAGVAVPFATIERGTGRVVGSTRFADIQRYQWPAGSPLERPIDSVEIGWTWLATDAQRTGINTEAKYLMLGHAFETWRVHRVTIQTDERNARSRAAIERIGGRFEGILRAVRAGADGAMRNSAAYSITEPDWPGVKAALEAKLRVHAPAGR